MTSHILYTTFNKKAKGCDICNSLIEKYKPATILIQDVRSLHHENCDLPEWLHGVPTLVTIHNRNVYIGHFAVDKVKEIISDEERKSENDLSDVTDDNGDVEGDNMDSIWNNKTELTTYESEGKITDDDIKQMMQERESYETNPPP